MSVELVTGQGASDHIGSEDFGAFNAYTFGVGNYVLSGCEAEAIDANTIRVNAGELLLQGRHVRVKGFEDIKIQSGSPGRNRNDLIVVRYTKDAGNIEDAPIVALPGTPIEGTAQDPAHVNGSILDGDLAVDIPLYRIKITGITVAPPELLIERTGSLWDSLSQKADTGHKHSAADITSGTLPIARGGTGATSAAAARSNLGITMANMNNHYICARGSATTQNLGANTITTLALNTNIATKGSNYTYSGGGIRVAQAGDYLVGGSAYLENKGNGDRVAFIYNGSTELTSAKDAMMQTGGASIGPVSIAPKIVTLAAGSVLYLKGRTTAAGIAYTANAGTYLTVMKVR